MDKLTEYLAGFDLPHVDILPGDATEEHDKDWVTLEVGHARGANRVRILRGRAWQARVVQVMAEGNEERGVVSDIARAFSCSPSTIRRYRRLAVGLQEIFSGEIAIVGSTPTEMADGVLALPLGAALQQISVWRGNREDGVVGADSGGGGSANTDGSKLFEKAAGLRKAAIKAALAVPEQSRYSALQDLIDDAVEAQRSLPEALQPLDDHLESAQEPIADGAGIFISMSGEAESEEGPVGGDDATHDPSGPEGDKLDDGSGVPEPRPDTDSNNGDRQALVDKALNELKSYGCEGATAAVVGEKLGMSSKRVAALLREGGANPFRKKKGRYAANWIHPDFVNNADRRMTA